MASQSLKTHRNGLLACLSDADHDLLSPRLRPVELKLRQRLELPHRQIRAVYFVERGLVSVVAVGAGERHQAEVGLIGREGMTGLAVVMGLDRSPHDTFVQGAGRAQCITAADLQDAMNASRSLLARLLHYAHVCSVTLAHTALANARASLEERLARWLLMAHDRSDNDEIALTHEFLSLMLGTRRAGVTTALHTFDTRGWISQARGRITVVDRDGLQQLAAGFYGVAEAECHRALGSTLIQHNDTINRSGTAPIS
jgi:CRP-like cAMP-binding protein